MIVNNLKTFSFTLSFYRYKEHVISLGAIVVGLLLLVFFVVPQSQVYFAQKEEEQVLGEKNKVLSKNIALISSMNESTLEHQFTLASKAILSDKDYASVMDSISRAGQRSGVSLGDFAFTVGDLSNRSVTKGSDSSFTINILVKGKLGEIEKFIDSLSSQTPLVVITGVEVSQENASVHATFPYKQFSLKSFSSLDLLKDFTAEDKKMLSVFETWNVGW